MNCVENMRKILGGSGAYTLSGESMIDWELGAYGAGLGPLEEEAQKLQEDLFAMTAGGERLAVWERMYRRQASWAELETRRRGVAAALSRRGGPVLSGDMEGILAASGIKGSAQIASGKLVITVTEYQGVTESEALRLLGRLIPLHVEWEIEAPAA